MTANDEDLVQALTQEVLRRLSAAGARGQAASTPGLLVIGDTGTPEAADGEGIESYDCPESITRFRGVLITRLTNAQLADIALGRDSGREACAVTNALLRGVPVRMLPGAPSWRSCGNPASPALAATLEGYERTLTAYGVRIHCPDDACDRPSPAAPTVRAGRRVISADVAKELIARGGEVRLGARDIVTALAEDAFRAAGITVRREAKGEDASC